jgi:glucose/arabinose dehydrogenase
VLLGRILRIDPRRGDPFAVPADNPFVGVPDARPEIWAYGLRNPWRFWIDRETDTLYVPDVGSTSREEINVVPNRGRADNFGWPCFEGYARLRRERDVQASDRATRRVPAGGWRVRSHRRRRRERPRIPASPAGTSSATSAPAR